MALTAKSLIVYGLQVSADNEAIDFRAVALETPRQATLRRGYYSLDTLANEVKRALESADPARTYTVTVDRTAVGGTQNRFTVATSGAHFQMLFLTGPRNAATCCVLIGFSKADRTGALTYTGNATSGTAVSPEYVGYNYLSTDHYQRNFGTVNVSASGVKESVVFQVQEFAQVQFKYISKAAFDTLWKPLMRWMIQQRPVDFTPEITSPTVYFDGTLESTTADGKGLAYKMVEMLPQMPNMYDTGILIFRKRVEGTSFIV